MSSFLPRRVRLFLFNAFFLLLAPAWSLSADIALVRPAIVSARTMGYGGAYTALEAGFDTLTTNPAALAYVSSEWSISRIAAHVSGPLFDMASVNQADDLTTGLLDLVGENNGLYLGAEVTGPFAFGKVDKNFGFGIFNRSIATANIPSLTKATVYTGEEFLLTGGYGLSILDKGSHSLAIGFQLKGFVQTFLFEEGTSITVLNAFTNFNVDSIPTKLSTGFGVDAGVMYRFLSRFSAAIVCRDLYTPVFSSEYDTFSDFSKGSSGSTTSTDRLDSYLSAGVVYSVPLPESWATITDWNLMVDYRDFLDLLSPLYRNPVLNAAIGTELVFLDVVSLRAGIAETYLSTGLGLDLSLFTIDCAMYGSELGLDPGKRPVLNMALSVSFQY